MKRIAITGSMGSGKSTVSQILRKLGHPVYDADLIAKKVLQSEKTKVQLIERYGEQILNEDLSINKTFLASRIFNNLEDKAHLEAIIHPLVGQETDRQAQQALAAGHPMLVFDVPLLVESGTRWRGRVDRVWVVDCDPATQIERVMARNQLPREQVEQILAAQSPRAQRLAAADMVLFNGAGTTLDTLRQQVQRAAATFGL